MFAAKHHDKFVATALCIKDETTLYGRYWGALETFDSLHFETCYYTGIEYCIQQKLLKFDPGAQGEHKIQRGFKPIFTWPSHYIAEAGFNDAIGRFVAEEQNKVNEQIKELTTWLPFKQP